MTRQRPKTFFACAFLLLFPLWASVAASDLPGNLRAGKRLYQNSLENADSVAGWRMEGPGKVSFKDGWMEMHSPGERMHHVYWCPQRFPESFIAQWEAQNLETDAGLCIVFFAAAARNGGSIFAKGLPRRNGTFSQYTKGALRCYHASYYANAAHNPDRQQTNLRKNPGFHLVQEGQEGIPTKSKAIHTITLAKIKGHLRLWVDKRKVIDWTDSGKQGGPPHGDGFLGLRQMKWTRFRYRNLRVWSVPGGRAEKRQVTDSEAVAAATPFTTTSPSGYRLVRLTPPDQFCNYSGYNTSPENTDGTLISYTRFPEKPRDAAWGKSAEIWVCNRDGTDHRKVAEVANDNVHNGAEVNWIDDTFATARNVVAGEAVGSAVLNMRTGEVVHGPYVGLSIIHETINGLALGMVNGEKGPLAEGVWRIDTRDGSTRHLLSKRDLLPWKDKMDGSDDTDDWGISHPEWSPSGEYFAIVLFHNWKQGYQFFFTREGKFHAFFGKKLSHPSWYDDKTVYGERGRKTMLATLSGKILKTVGGHSCHPALSPDRRWIATEVDWNKPDIKILRYSWGETQPDIIDRHSRGKLIWDLKAHTNTSYGHDNRRLYYVKPNAEGIVECWYAVLQQDTKEEGEPK